MKITSQLQKKIKHSIALLALGGLFLSYSTSAEAPLDIRVALVIGNAAYKNVPALANSTNDAKSMATVLRKLGFTVVEVVDGSKDQMSKAIAQMQGLLKSKQAVGMLYYAGHGLQLDWRNFMVPIDAKLEEASDVPKQTIDIENVIDVLRKSGTRMNIIVLDACRDNPFAEKASGKGLAQLDAPPGTYLAFATSPGNVAEDGDVAAGNGLFTQFLLKELQRPAKIEEVFKRVRLQVRQKSQGRQIPWDSSSLEDEFAFNDGSKFTFKPEDLLKEAQAAKEKEERLQQEAIQAAEREKKIAQQREVEKQRLAEAQKIQELQARQKAEAEVKERERQLTVAAEQERRHAMAKAQELEQARITEAQRLKDLEQSKALAADEDKRKKLSIEAAREQQFNEQKAEWDKIKDSKNVQDFYAFLLKYPSGFITEQATFAIAHLEKSKLIAHADKNGVVQQTGIARYRVGDFVETRTLNESGQVVFSQKRTVTRIDGGLVYENNSNEPTRTIDGALIKVTTESGTVRYDPPRLEIPGDEFSVGKKWTWRSTMILPRGSQRQIESDVKIVAFEEITVPAGTFKTFKVTQVQKESGGTIFNTLNCWYEANWGMTIRCTRDFPSGRYGRPLKETVELVSYQKAHQ
jgi:uncharacterized caspase-like protein